MFQRRSRHREVQRAAVVAVGQQPVDQAAHERIASADPVAADAMTVASYEWYGRRIHPVAARLKQGENRIEIHVVTVMGNYLKTLKDNKIAQAWTRRQDVVQPAGLVGPVTAYRIKN